MAQNETTIVVSRSVSVGGYQSNYAEFYRSLYPNVKVICVDSLPIRMHLALLVFLSRPRLIFLHSTNANGILFSRIELLFFRHFSNVIHVYLGNEYKLMPEKMRFCKLLGPQVVYSQIDRKRVLSGYRKYFHLQAATRATKVRYRNNGLSPRKSISVNDAMRNDRDIDLVYRGASDIPYLGSDFRKKSMAYCFRARCYGLTVDFSDVPVSYVDWLALLKRSKSSIVLRSGSKIFSMTDRHRVTLNADAKIDPINYIARVRTKIDATMFGPRLFDCFRNGVIPICDDPLEGMIEMQNFIDVRMVEEPDQLASVLKDHSLVESIQRNNLKFILAVLEAETAFDRSLGNDLS